MRDELLVDVLEDISLAEQMADNPQIKKLLHCYNRMAAVSGTYRVIEITEPGSSLKEAISLLSAKEQLKLLSKYHNTHKDIEEMERDNQMYRLINTVITWTMALITIIVLASIALLFLSTFYEKTIPGIELIKDSLNVLFEIFKLIFPN